MLTVLKFVKYGVLCFAVAFGSLAAAAEMRTMRYQKGTAEQTTAWQNELRAKLFKILKMDDLLPDVSKLPFDAKELRTWDMPGYTVKEMSIRSTPGRMMEIVLTVPKEGQGPFPAVVCIGGHSSTKFSPYNNGKAFGPLPAAKTTAARSTRALPPSWPKTVTSPFPRWSASTRCTRKGGCSWANVSGT